MNIFHINFEQGISVFRSGVNEIASLGWNLDSVPYQVGGFGARNVLLSLLSFEWMSSEVIDGNRSAMFMATLLLMADATNSGVVICVRKLWRRNYSCPHLKAVLGTQGVLERRQGP